MQASMLAIPYTPSMQGLDEGSDKTTTVPLRRPETLNTVPGMIGMIL